MEYALNLSKRNQSGYLLLYTNYYILTPAGEIHGSGNGVISVDRQCDKYVCRTVRNDGLHEPYQFAGNVARVPGHRRSPNYIR